jgi:hypothetical protein
MLTADQIAEKVLADLGYYPEANIPLNWLDARNAIITALSAPQSITHPEVGGELVERVITALKAAFAAGRCSISKPTSNHNHGGYNSLVYGPWPSDESFREQAIATLSTPEVVDGTAGLVAAGQAIIDGMFSTYKARNGREVGIQGDDGEKCWIVHDDDILALRTALAQHRGVS